MPVKSYQDLIAWRRAMELVVEVYEMTKGFPKDERFGLTNQVRRAAVSVPSNIAEGQGRGVGAEFAHHLRIAQGSLQEVETQVMLGQRLGFPEAAPSSFPWLTKRAACSGGFTRPFAADASLATSN